VQAHSRAEVYSRPRDRTRANCRRRTGADQRTTHYDSVEIGGGAIGASIAGRLARLCRRRAVAVAY